MRLLFIISVLFSMSIFAQDEVGTQAPVAQTTQQELETRNDEVQNTNSMYLMIRPFICPSDLPAPVCQQISRILIQTASKQTFYQIMLTPLGDYKIMKGVFHEVDLQVKKVNGVHYEIDATLKNLKKNKLLKIVTKKNVVQGNLIHNVDLAIELLFADLPSIIEEDKEKPVPPPVKKVMTLKEKVILQARESPIDDKGLDAFKKRIMKIKSGLDVKTVEVAEQIEEAKDVEEEPTKPAPAKLAKNLLQENLEPNPKKKNKPFVWYQDLFVGYTSKNLQSTEALVNNVSFQVKTDLAYICLYYNRGLYLDDKKLQALEGRLTYGKLSSAPGGLEVPNYYSINLNYSYYFKKQNVLLKGGVYQEPIDFVGLPEIGGGLQAGRIQARWIPISGRLENVYWRRTFFWTLYYHHLLSGQSDYETLKKASYSGNKIGLNVEVARVWKNFGLSVNLETLSVDGKGERALNIKGSTYQIGTTYKF